MFIQVLFDLCMPGTLLNPIRIVKVPCAIASESARGLAATADGLWHNAIPPEGALRESSSGRDHI